MILAPHEQSGCVLMILYVTVAHMFYFILLCFYFIFLIELPRCTDS